MLPLSLVKLILRCHGIEMYNFMAEKLHNQSVVVQIRNKSNISYKNFLCVNCYSSSICFCDTCQLDIYFLSKNLSFKSDHDPDGTKCMRAVAVQLSHILLKS